MTGTGAKENPYIVMDGADFNALRSISTSTTNITHVELGADIILDAYDNFTPIPQCYMNIDGKNFSISEYKINSTTEAALFVQLHTQYVKDLVLEGEVTSTSTNTSGTGGLLAARIIGRNAEISNVKGFGNVRGRIVGGLIGHVNDEEYNVSTPQTAGTTNIRKCSFKGKVTCAPTGSVSTSIGSTMCRIGGLFATIQNQNGSNRANFTLSECLAIATLDNS